MKAEPSCAQVTIFHHFSWEQPNGKFVDMSVCDAKVILISLYDTLPRYKTILFIISCDTNNMKLVGSQLVLFATVHTHYTIVGFTHLAIEVCPKNYLSPHFTRVCSSELHTVLTDCLFLPGQNVIKEHSARIGRGRRSKENTDDYCSRGAYDVSVM